jgi:hypothetical protein
VREIDETLDSEFLPLRMIATWEAEEWIERGVTERDYPSSTSA